MRSPLVPLLVAVVLWSEPAHAADPVAACETFLASFQKCVDGLKGEQQEEARIFLKTMRGTQVVTRAHPR